MNIRVQLFHRHEKIRQKDGSETMKRDTGSWAGTEIGSRILTGQCKWDSSQKKRKPFFFKWNWASMREAAISCIGDMCRIGSNQILWYFINSISSALIWCHTVETMAMNIRVSSLSQPTIGNDTSWPAVTALFWTPGQSERISFRDIQTDMHAYIRKKSVADEIY